MDWEKISVNHVADKGLIYSIDEELSQLNNKNSNELKMNKGLEQIFSKDSIMAEKHIGNAR